MSGALACCWPHPGGTIFTHLNSPSQPPRRLQALGLVTDLGLVLWPLPEELERPRKHIERELILLRGHEHFTLGQDPTHPVFQYALAVRFFATPQTVAHQASLSMGFSRQEYWSGLP